jgi:hypothetical protein
MLLFDMVVITNQKNIILYWAYILIAISWLVLILIRFIEYIHIIWLNICFYILTVIYLQCNNTKHKI